MPDKITMDGKYTTRDGRPVRILCVDGPRIEPVVGVVGEGVNCTFWTAEGKDASGRSDFDLIPLKPRVQCNLAIYRDTDGSLRSMVGKDCHRAVLQNLAVKVLAYIPIDVEEGEGLDQGPPA